MHRDMKREDRHKERNGNKAVGAQENINCY